MLTASRCDRGKLSEAKVNGIGPENDVRRLFEEQKDGGEKKTYQAQESKRPRALVVLAGV